MTQSDLPKMEIVRTFADLARLDPAYRDVYRQRAREMLRDLLSPEAYKMRRRDEDQLGIFKRALREAVARHEWARIASLAGGVRAIGARLAGARDETALAREVYDPTDVPISSIALPSARLIPGGRTRFREARAELLSLLDRLPKGEEEWAPRVAERREALCSFPEPEEGDTNGTLDDAQMEAKARRAIEREQWDELERLAKDVHPVAAETGGHCGCGPEAEKSSSKSLWIEESTVAAAMPFGLEPLQVDMAPSLQTFMSCRCTATPRFNSGPTGAGAGHAAHRCRCNDRCPELTGELRTNLDLLKHRLFVSSRGDRYLPRFRTEELLLERFPEDETAARRAGPLLEALGIHRRTGVSRWEIEEALTERGPEVVTGLGLDPWQYCLVCVPFDVYQRVARRFGWGRRPWWTHFDGYSVWRGWQLRGIVGGHVEYGGPDDLASLSLTHGRDNTLVRLAVVERQRLMEAAPATD